MRKNTINIKNIIKATGYYCLLLALLLPAGSFAQRLSLPQSIELAYKNNQFLLMNELETEAQQVLIKTARDLPKTTLDVQYGRTQAPRTNDYIVNLVQQFAHPKLYQANKTLQESYVEASRRNNQLTKNELAAAVKQLYYQMLYYQQLRTSLIQQDSLYRSSLKAAETKYKTGESNLLEKVNVEVRAREIANKLEILKRDEAITQQQLQTLLHLDQPFQVDLLLPLKRDTTQILRPAALSGNPLLSIAEQQLTINKQLTNLERQKLKPDFRVGLTNQSIEHINNQIALMGGIGIPIFTKAQKARIEAAKVNEKIKETHIQYVETQLTGQLNILKKDYEKHQQSLAYYENFALPQADLIIRNATKSYKSGEIDYMEFIQNSQQAWQIKDAYLLTTLNFNQTVIQIETILGIQ